MRWGAYAIATAIGAIACSGRVDSSGGTGATSGAAAGAGGCDGGGASYDVSRSKFAFGSTPTSGPMPPPLSGTRWVGPDGVLVIEANGSVMGLLNGGAPEQRAAPWSEDRDALTAHVREYFESQGVSDCQILRTNVNGGSDGPTIALTRGIDGIPFVESNAWAHFIEGDHTTHEGFYWPTVPADVVAAARAFKDRLATPDGLAAYKAKLPANAQGSGSVVIHHTSGVVGPEYPADRPFVAMPTWDVTLSGPMGFPAQVSFDTNGVRVDTSRL